MKFLTAIIFLIYTSAFGMDILRLEPMNYIVQKDTLDSSIEKGFFRISGEVKMFSSANPIANVLSGCTSSGTWVRTGANGKFDLLLKTTDSVVYFYHEGWSEVVIENYQFQEGHHIEIDVFMNQVVSTPDNQIMKRKPVIYLYSEVDQHVQLKIDPLGEFTFTYPTYKNGWNVEIKNNELVVDSKKYPYLFWEATSPDLNYNFNPQSIEGSIVETSDLTSFFENSLAELGLNQTEMTDFITYWVPALSGKSHCFIQFVIDEAYENKIAALKMEPQAESSRRIFIIASELDGDNIGIDVQPQQFESFERNGLTIVEWGGAIVDLNELGL